MLYKYIIGGLSYYILQLKGNKNLKSKYLLFLLIPFAGEIAYNFSQWKKSIFSFVKSLPYIKQKLEKEVSKEINKIRPSLIEDRYKDINKNDIITDLPEHSVSSDIIMERLNKIEPVEPKHYPWKISGAIYTNKNTHAKIIGHIYEKFGFLSPTHPDLWPNLQQGQF